MIDELLPAGSDRRVLYAAAEGRWWNADELRAECSELAAAMCDALDGEAGLVFLFCRNDVPSIVGYLAALDAGLPVALIAATLPEELRAPLVAAYRPSIILGDDRTRDGYRASAHRRDWPSIHVTESRPAIRPFGDLAVLLPTSGSTGSPKFVRLSRSALLANAASIAQALGITSDERAVTSLPFHYSYGLSVINSHLLRGAEIVVTDEQLFADKFWDALRDQECTSFAGVPYSYQILNRLNLDRLRLPSVRTLTQAGGRLDEKLILEFHDKMAARGGRFFVMYGQTEATARIAILPANRLPDKLGFVGPAIPGGRLSILDETGESKPPGEIGDVVYEGPNVMLGYAEGFDGLAAGDEMRGRLETGDLGFLDDEGFLRITGRRKRIAKAFGTRLNLDEVEADLATHGANAVICQNEKIVIVCENWAPERMHAAKGWLVQRYKIHASALNFRSVPALPRLNNGKTDYKTLEGA